MVYFQHDVALVHARGYGGYADDCAPGIVELLSGVRGGLVLEIGCGAGALTRHLLADGFTVIGTERRRTSWSSRVMRWARRRTCAG